ncbi:uncharacterized protein TEOVI_000408500 [Trypanosoma equiperdum]|nr:hypothetical protein, conserved [Trypanosoma equiperdum]
MLLAHRPKSATGPVLPESPVLEPNMFKCFNPISTMSSVQSNPVVRPRPYVNMGAEGGHSNDISRRRGTSALRPVGRNLKMCSPLPCINITLGDVGVDENLWQESGLPQSWRPLSSTAKCVQRSLLRNVNRLCQSTLGRRPSNLAFCRNVVKRYVQKVQSCGSGDFSPPRLSGALIRKQILRYSANRARTLRHSAKRLPRRAFFVKQCILARRGAELCSNWVLVPLELRHLGGRHPPSVSPNSSFRMSP